MGRCFVKMLEDVSENRLCLAKASGCMKLLAEIRASEIPVFRTPSAGRRLRPFVKSRGIAAKAEKPKKSVHLVGKIHRPRHAGIERSVDCGKQVRQLPPRDCPHRGNVLLRVLRV